MRLKLRKFDVPWRARDGFIVFFMAWIGLPILTELTMMVLGQQSALLHQWYLSLVGGSITANFVLSALNALAATVFIGLYLRHYHAHWTTLGLRRFSWWKAALLIIAIYVGFSILILGAFALVSALWPAFDANQAQNNEFTKPSTGSTHALSLIALVIIPAFVEETVFRGFVFPAFSKRFGVILGAIGSSAIFAFAHLQLNVSIYTFLLGLLLCFMYYRLRSIWPGIFFHALNNYIAFLVIMKK